jgi:hypothetical protein
LAVGPLGEPREDDEPVVWNGTSIKAKPVDGLDTHERELAVQRTRYGLGAVRMRRELRM